MRTNLTLALLSAALLANAQVNNGGFEDLNSGVLPEYWQGDIHLLAITIDSMGVEHVDSVVYDGGTDYALSTDAHTGEYAMELRNGFNYTQNAPLIGRVHASNDTGAYQGFPLVSVPVTQRPASIGFWAKYAPLADDSAEVTINVLDEAQNTIGTGLLTIGGVVPQYTAFEVPIAYASQDVAAFIQLTFANARYEGTASLGTRLLIDDVSMTFAPDGVSERILSEARVELFPVPANDRCSVRMADGSSVMTVDVLSVDGRTSLAPDVRDGGFDTASLPAGSYVVAVRTRAGTARARLSVAH